MALRSELVEGLNEEGLRVKVKEGFSLNPTSESSLVPQAGLELAAASSADLKNDNSLGDFARRSFVARWVPNPY